MKTAEKRSRFECGVRHSIRKQKCGKWEIARGSNGGCGVVLSCGETLFLLLSGGSETRSRSRYLSSIFLKVREFGLFRD